MDDIKKVGTVQMLDSIYDVEFIPTGVEGDLGLLLFGDTISSHAISMPPGLYPAHSHGMELLILCVKGKCDIFQEGGGERREMNPLSMVWVPANEGIGVEVKGEEPCDLVVVASPKRMSREEFYARLRKSHEGKG